MPTELTLSKNYQYIKSAIYDLARNDVPKDVPLTPAIFDRVEQYFGKTSLDPYQFMIDIEMFNKSLVSMTDLIDFNIICYLSPFCINGVFNLTDDEIANNFSSSSFLACTYALRKANEHIYCNKALVHNNLIKMLTLVDSHKPLLFAKMFTSNVKWFCGALSSSNSVGLIVFIANKFKEKMSLDRATIGTVLSLFNKEMAKYRTLAMHLN